MDRAFSPLACRWTLLLGRCPRLGWNGPLALSNSSFDRRSREMAFVPSDSSANGAPHLSLWATLQDNVATFHEG